MGVKNSMQRNAILGKGSKEDPFAKKKRGGCELISIGKEEEDLKVIIKDYFQQDKRKIKLVGQLIKCKSIGR